MPLSDAQIERYSRQILLPEIGGRGQERLLGARIALAGSDRAAVAAATLLGRAGVGTLDLLRDMPDLPELSPDCRATRHTRLDDAPSPDVSIDLGRDRARTTGHRPLLVGGLDGTRAALLTLVERPCAACAPADIFPPPSTSDDGPFTSSAALALGALAATEAMRVLVLSPRRGRRVVMDMASGTVEARELEATPGCDACRNDP